MASKTPLLPDEVLAAAKQSLPRLGIATVYRCIRRLVSAGVLTVVTLPGDPARYMVAGKGHSHFFHCAGCRKVYEVHGCHGAIDSLVPGGFRVDSHEVVLYGACADCNAKGRGETSRTGVV